MTRSEVHTKILEVMISVKTEDQFNTANNFLNNYMMYYMKDAFDEAIAHEAFKILYSKDIIH